MRLLLSYKPNVSLHVDEMAKADHNIRCVEVIDISDCGLLCEQLALLGKLTVEAAKQ